MIKWEKGDKYIFIFIDDKQQWEYKIDIALSSFCLYTYYKAVKLFKILLLLILNF